jgi:hypothetical protein
VTATTHAIVTTGPADAIKRPWLFLDVDGVVAPVGPARLDETRPPPGYRTWPEARWSVYVHENLDRWGRELDEKFEVLWTTDWQHHAPVGIGEPAGLPDWPYLPLDHNDSKRLRNKLGHKMAAISKVLATDPRPFAWIDDKLVGPGPRRILEIDLPKLLIKPVTRVGITREHIDRLLAFAVGLTQRPTHAEFTSPPDHEHERSGR